MHTKDLSSATVTKIVESSIELFNKHGYAGTSISDISKKAEMSKGILYHYFKNKDELYLHCAKTCIKDFKSYLKEECTSAQTTGKDAALNILRFRLRFFEKYPQYCILFHNILAQKPVHLANELFEIRRPFKEENLAVFKAALNDVNLGKGITTEDALNFLAILQNSTTHIVETLTDIKDIKAQEQAIMRIATIFINGLEVNLNNECAK